VRALNQGATGNYLSTKDTIFGILFGFSALLGFALSFSVLQPNGRPFVFCGCLFICAICILIVDKKKEVVLGSLLFIALRVVWSLSVAAIQYLQSGAVHH